MLGLCEGELERQRFLDTQAMGREGLEPSTLRSRDCLGGCCWLRLAVIRA